MKLTGLHLMLTWQCLLECDHCFVWGSPRQSGTWKLGDIRNVLDQAAALGSVEWIYFEGGEPFLYYPLLLKSVQEAAQRGLRVGIVSNGYWAIDREDAVTWLQPFAGLVDDLSISSDRYHWDENLSRLAHNASLAAKKLGIPIGMIEIAPPEAAHPGTDIEQQDSEQGTLMFRGRAAVKLSGRVPHKPWEQFSECPYEDLRDPGRVHVDPYGNIHICQGISLGNMLDQSLQAICAGYQAESHPIAGPLLRGGPAGLAREYEVPHAMAYADACHLCYITRLALRERFPDILAPDGMYMNE